MNRTLKTLLLLIASLLAVIGLLAQFGTVTPPDSAVLRERARVHARPTTAPADPSRSQVLSDSTPRGRIVRLSFSRAGR